MINVEKVKNIGPTPQSTVIHQDSLGVQENLTNSSMPVTEAKTSSLSNISSTIKATIDTLPKAVYDSLAPLNLPSKPIIYSDDKQAIDGNNSQKESSTTSTTTTNSSDAITSKTVESSNTAIEKEKAEISRLDEKAKLESILFNSMSQTSSSYQQKGIYLLNKYLLKSLSLKFL
jgi:hypothetical protein